MRGALMRGLAALFACVLLLTAWDAQAGCTRRDSWKGPDKRDHALIGAAISGAATLHTGDPWQGFLWGVGIGLLKEAADSGGLGTCSLQDFAVTAAGAAIGAGGGRLMLQLNRDGGGLLYVTRF